MIGPIGNHSIENHSITQLPTSTTIWACDSEFVTLKAGASLPVRAIVQIEFICNCLGTHPIEGLALDDVQELLEDVKSIFAHGADETLDAGIDVGALESAERHGDFLLDFHAPNISFGLVIREGNAGRKGKCQDARLMTEQAIQKIAPFALGLFAAFFGSIGRSGRRFFCVGFGGNLLKNGLPLGPFGAEIEALFDLLVEREQQVLHPNGPVAAALLTGR